jgi:hypothetical protein
MSNEIYYITLLVAAIKLRKEQMPSRPREFREFVMKTDTQTAHLF